MKLGFVHSTLVAALSSTLAVATLGCSRNPTGTTNAQGTGTPATASGASECAAKFVSINPKATAAEKDAYAKGCGSLSSKTLTCIAGVSTEQDLKACMTDKAEQQAFMNAVVGGTFPTAAASTGSPRTAKIDKLGLQIDVPGEPYVTDGLLPKSAMVNATAMGGLDIGEASASTAKSLKAAKADAQMFKPKNVQGEQTADGYWLTFENTGSMGTNYWVKTLRKVGGKSYTCDAAPDSADKAAQALAACKSLRPS